MLVMLRILGLEEFGKVSKRP